MSPEVVNGSRLGWFKDGERRVEEGGTETERVTSEKDKWKETERVEKEREEM